MEGSERDSTQDWALPADSRPPLVGELEERIDEALTLARASEASAVTVGAAALDAAERSRQAAEHARRAADVAERASEVALECSRSAGAGSPAEPSGLPGSAGRAGSPPPDDSMQSFSERADRIVARLRALQSA